MKENKFLSILTGLILGLIFGNFYYNMPAKCLITGTMPQEGLFIPTEINNAILWEGLFYGGIPGAIIGILSALSIPITMPRGHLSKSISATAFVICSIIPFIMHGAMLLEMSGKRIFITFIWVFVALLLAIPMGRGFSFIEKIRENF